MSCFFFGNFLLVIVLTIWDGRQTFSVENTGDTSKTYKLTHFPAGTALTVNAVRSSIHPQRLRTKLTSSFADNPIRLPRTRPTHQHFRVRHSGARHIHPLARIIPNRRCHLLSPQRPRRRHLSPLLWVHRNRGPFRELARHVHWAGCVVEG